MQPSLGRFVIESNRSNRDLDSASLTAWKQFKATVKSIHRLCASTRNGAFSGGSNGLSAEIIPTPDPSRGPKVSMSLRLRARNVKTSHPACLRFTTFLATPAVDCTHRWPIPIADESGRGCQHEQTAHHLTRIDRGAIRRLVDAKAATLRSRPGTAAPRVLCGPSIDLALAALEWQSDFVMRL
jgi:hypothetical protein